MISTGNSNSTNRLQNEACNKLDFLVQQGKRLGLLVIGGNGFEDVSRSGELLETFRERVGFDNGQCLSLDSLRFDGKSFAEALLSELESAHTDQPLRIDLPLTTSKSPFIRRAIVWQRLCDRLVEDEEPHRSTLLVLENFDEADERTQCEVERLVRFHQTHQIRRTFLLTVRNRESLNSSLLRLVDLEIEI